ncbi:hypothetical protein FOMPIDRAFT_58988 [Fomitopsis schrenkii]|uniref:DDE Tnp4 domain-containing protein n=1 Tax=Fomitopsis schrenkii TaxID=2126942 RepID=S8ETQ0_FOMSC|nr:hypothetical protein FOMPIDRAFT_58988 [Fomitopsis schrenkii]
MPYRTDRQLAADALECTFLVEYIAKLEASLYGDDFDPSPEDLPMDVDSSSLSSSSSSSSSTSSTSSSSTASSSSQEGLLGSSLAIDNYVLLMGELFSRQYLADREDIEKASGLMNLVLNNYKHDRPEIFKSYVRMTPACFDDLVSTLRDHEVFQNHSNNPQLPIEQQLLIALYRFGHYGNAASTMKVALQFGVSYRMVHLATARVMKACCTDKFRCASVQWPTAAAQELAKEWIEAHSCPAWRNRWLMVDGTLVPIYRRPGHFGNAFFDRKSNYSFNVQLISTPDLRIIDYVVGLAGSQNDAAAWSTSRVVQQHEDLLQDDEWVWADTAYPVRKWCQAPYKK